MGVVLITGGSRGIGRAIAINFAEYGYDIAICYAGNEAAANETIEVCKEKNVRAIAIKADISNAIEVENLFRAVKEELGAVDILINNAGITRDGLLLKMSEEDFDSVIDTNLKGTFLCTRQAIKDMLKARKGSIVNISSIVGIQGNAGQVNYSASKAGLIGFTKSVAREYGSKGIRCNAVAPGFIETEMTEKLPDDVRKAYLEKIALKKLGTVQNVADCVYFLASNQAEYITGQVISVDGGM